MRDDLSQVSVGDGWTESLPARVRHLRWPSAGTVLAAVLGGVIRIAAVPGSTATTAGISFRLATDPETRAGYEPPKDGRRRSAQASCTLAALYSGGWLARRRTKAGQGPSGSQFEYRPSAECRRILAEMAATARPRPPERKEAAHAPV